MSGKRRNWRWTDGDYFQSGDGDTWSISIFGSFTFIITDDNIYPLPWTTNTSINILWEQKETMKLLLALANLFNSELINSTARAYCYAPDIFLQTPSYAQKASSLEDCNSRCSRDRACNFFQFNIRKHKCFFFKNQRKLRSSVTSTRTSLQHNALWVRVQQRHVQPHMHSNNSNEPWILSWARRTSVWGVFEWVGIMAIQVMFLTRLSLD